MSLPRLLAAALLSALLLSAASCGSSSPDPESDWREEVDGALESLEGHANHRYRVILETWIGVSGQSVYGDEKGEGSRSGGEFSVSIDRTCPAGEENLVFTSLEEGAYLREEGAWRSIARREAPSPLYDPVFFAALVSSYVSISLEGEDERCGIACRRYLLQLDSNKAREALPERAWSYFSSLQHELNCRVWVSGADAPPVLLQLEVAGFDPRESLQRYRVVANLEPYDLDSLDIRLILPGE
jgi:hypothetical protein